MKRWIKLLVTVALAVSIPLQGFAAVMMPACNSSNMAMHDSVSMNKTSMVMHMDATTAKSTHCDKNCCEPTTSSHTCADQKCFICHLSVFHVPDTQLLILVDNATTTYHDLISEPYQIISPPLFHPPKSISA